MYTLASMVCLVAAVAMAPCVFCSELTVGGPLEKGFQVSPSQISIQWGTFSPFLTSPGGIFSLGFENIENGYVLAIMYTIRSNNVAVSQYEEPPLNMEMVWSAISTNSPSTKDATLSINQQGNLLLSDASKGKILWTTGTSNPGTTNLFLQDSGNLILSASTTVANVQAATLWQSFDHPTDTLLQGQNFTASMNLTSSLRPASSNSAQGAAVYCKMEVDGIALYADLGRNASQLMYWELQADQETALINPEGDPIYARMNAMGYLGMYETEDQRVSYEVFDTYNSTEVAQRRLKLDSDGNLRVYYWLNASWQIDFQAVDEPCALPSPCGPFGICSLSDACLCPGARGVIISDNDQSAGNATFISVNASDASQGCVLSNADSVVQDDVCVPADKGVQVTSPPKSAGLFMQLAGVDSLFHAMSTTHVNASSVEACEGLCSRDCACIAFFYRKGSASNCFLAYQPEELSLVQTGIIDNLAFIRLSKAAAAAPSYATPQARSPPAHRRSAAVPIIATIASLVAVAGAVCGLAVWRRKARKAKEEGDPEKKAFLAEIPGLPASVSYKDIEVCSAHFKRYRRAGSLGNLYEGTLAGGARVAIARLRILNQYDLHDIKLTLASVGRMRDPNLAKLCCYAIDGANLALCYELPPNGWLDLAALSWQQRVDVGIGVARALAALHEGAKMVHGLLNLAAVFVAGGCEAKVAGVGVAELTATEMPAPLDSAVTAAPKLAESADVEQFGVVLTQLLTGQRLLDDAARWRLRWRDAIGQARIIGLLDPIIQADATCAGGDLVARLATVAGLCLHPSPLQRPSIGTVIRILHGSLTNLPLI